ncbi:MAG TPA: hypothetical protein VGR57_04865 [Ktedonobacterales bacterium]|nr:hypothetical protein [Ktedonobacterales bacterium]
MNDPTMLELATVAIAVLALFAVARTYRVRERRLEGRVERLEARIYRLMHHDGVSDRPEDLAATRRLVEAGNIQGAIAAYRDATGASEADARNVVEGMKPKPEKKK